jgi:phosphate-selective porin
MDGAALIQEIFAEIRSEPVQKLGRTNSLQWDSAHVVSLVRVREEQQQQQTLRLGVWSRATVERSIFHVTFNYCHFQLLE